MEETRSTRAETQQLRAITDAMTVFLASGDVGAASQPLLEGAFELTGSEYGFVGVLADGPVLRVLAHRGLVWDRTENRAFYEHALRRYAEVGYLEFGNLDTLFGHVLKTGRPLIANDAARHPAARGIPPGHPPLRHFLGVPFRWGAQVVGMIGVANHPAGYGTRELQRLEGLANAAGVLFDSYRRRERQASVESSRRRTEVALRESNQQLERALHELEAAQQQVVREERLRAVGLMASGIAHDFNNALQAILGWVDLLIERPQLLEDRAQTLSSLRTVRTAARDASQLVDRLGAFYRRRQDDEPHAPVEIDALIDEVVALTRPRWRDEALAAGRTIRIATELEPTPVLLGDGAALRDALTNLVFNAIDALPEGGDLQVCARADDGRVCIEVRDSGVGMSAAVRARCLEPFFSTKEAPRSGMGLAMVWGVVRRHGGDVEIESAPQRGTCVRLRLPIASVPLAAGPGAGPGARPPPARRATERVPAPAAPPREPRPLRLLVVDDEPAVRDVLVRMLRHDGHHVDGASDGAQALSSIAAAGGPYDLVIADQAMPALTGLELAHALAHRGGGPPVLLLSGFADRLREEADAAPGIAAVLSKPVHPRDLRRAIVSACG